MDDGPSDTSTTLPPSIPEDRPARLIDGKYKLLSLIGEGGMGEVYLAEQVAPIRRRVALKVVKPGLETKEVLVRFRAEEQALALMSHPNIARVFDAGVTRQGRAYFVMEHVPGVPINEYCDANALSTRERLTLFLSVCDAIQHAHHKGVVHRDIKPQNVLVAVEGTLPIPKVIDFGIAKATARSLTDQTLYTQQGFFVGTPAYMSPEQAGVTALDIDTRSDIYSLGVLLYELLTGTLPFDKEQFRSAALAEIQRIIRETEPPRPSTRVTGLGATAAEIAKRRHTDTASLVRDLRQDLDWVILRALEKDRTRRYASASEFAADINRYLDDLPVVAGPPALTYRGRKFIRRHRVAVAAGAAVIGALVIGLVATSMMYLAARAATERAELSEEEAKRQACAANLNAATLNLQWHMIKEAKRRLADCDPSVRERNWWCLNREVDSSVATLTDPDDKPGQQPEVPDWSPTAPQRQTPQAVVDRLRVLPSAGMFSLFPSLYDRPVLVQITHHGSRIVGLASGPEWGPDGRVPSRRTVLVWQPAEYRLIARYDQEGIVAATSDGETLLVMRNDAYDVIRSTSKQLVATLKGVQPGRDNRPGAPFIFSADGRWTASCGRAGSSEDEAVHVWDARNGQLMASFPSPAGGGVPIAISENGSLLAVAGVAAHASPSLGQATQIWDVEKHLRVVTLSHPRPRASAIALSSDGARVAIGFSDGAVGVWDLPTGSFHGIGSIHEAQVTALAFSPDGRRLVSGSYDRTVCLWNIDMRRREWSQHGHEGSVTSVAFMSDAEHVVSGSVDGTVRVWNVVVPTR